MNLKSKGFKLAIFAFAWALSILLAVIVTGNVFDVMTSPASKQNRLKTVGKEGYSQLVRVKTDGIRKYTYYYVDGTSETTTYKEDSEAHYE